MSWAFNDQKNNFDHIKLTNSDKITIKNPVSDNRLANRKTFDDKLDKNSNLRVNQTIRNGLKVIAGGSLCNFTKNDRQRDIDTSNINRRLQCPSSTSVENNMSW